jgi:hypothetical protein
MRILALFTGLAIAILSQAPTAFASSGEQSLEVSCRFSGLENLYTDTELIALHISGSTAEITIDNDKKTVPVHKKTSDELESLKRSLRQNLQLFETGKDSYFGPEAAAKFLEIEHPYYTGVLDQSHTVTTYEFGEQDWYFELEEVYNFYDKDAKYLVSWAYSRFAGVFNFCIPQPKKK